MRFGPAIAPGEAAAEREDYGQAVLARRLRDTLARLNPHVPPAALDEAYRKLTRPDRPTLTANNHAAHRMLVEGVPVEYFRPDGSLGGDLVRVLDYDDRRTTTGWRSTSSPWWRTATSAARTWCCSSTACRWP